MQLIQLTNTDPDFYPSIGPFLANRAVHKALGGIPWDDDTKTWIAARTTAGTVAGFIAVAAHGHTTTVESLYTDGDTKLAARLVKGAVKAFGKDRTLTATVRHEHTAAYLAAGFTMTSETANFAKLTRTAA